MMNDDIRLKKLRQLIMDVLSAAFSTFKSCPDVRLMDKAAFYLLSVWVRG